MAAKKWMVFVKEFWDNHGRQPMFAEVWEAAWNASEQNLNSQQQAKAKTCFGCKYHSQIVECPMLKNRSCYILASPVR